MQHAHGGPGTPPLEDSVTVKVVTKRPGATSTLCCAVPVNTAVAPSRICAAVGLRAHEQASAGSASAAIATTSRAHAKTWRTQISRIYAGRVFDLDKGCLPGAAALARRCQRAR